MYAFSVSATTLQGFKTECFILQMMLLLRFTMPKIMRLVNFLGPLEQSKA